MGTVGWAFGVLKAKGGCESVGGVAMHERMLGCKGVRVTARCEEEGAELPCVGGEWLECAAHSSYNRYVTKTCLSCCMALCLIARSHATSVRIDVVNDSCCKHV